jgi:hypothetical protein
MNENSELSIIIDKLDKIIDLLSLLTLDIKVMSEETRRKINIDPGFICKDDNKDVTEDLIRLTRKEKPLIVERNAKGKRVRDGYLNDDGSVEWVRNYH